MLAAAAVLFALVGTAAAQVFPPDAPIWVDPDRLDMPAPAPHDINDYFDFWVNTFGSPGTYQGPAVNVNALGDVPASSWYTPRHYWRHMDLGELTRGPNESAGPSVAGPWEVVGGKVEGKTPGMQIEDARGYRYLLKFDVPGHIELTSGAEVISTKFFYALGYNVPENYPVCFDRERLIPAEDATFETPQGEEPVTQARIDAILSGAARYEDGSFRALASRYLQGEPIGPFLYYGTRPDDANDVFPHEGRRELRGLRVFSAWLNHTDARSANTLDMIVGEEGRRFVRHHLIDFGSTLGAGALGPKRVWDGFEYIIDPASILTRALTIGVAGLDWAAIDYPDVNAVGRIDAEHFDPESWKTQYPNQAFVRMDPSDAFWAAKQVAHFTEEDIRAIVESADYSSREAVETLTEILVGRRNKIAQAYLSHGGGLDRFEVVDGHLTFVDLPASHGLAPRSRTRHVIWRPFDNETGQLGAVMRAGESAGTRLDIPATDDAIIMAEVRSPGAGSTRVYLRLGDGERKVVGVNRSP